MSQTVQVLLNANNAKICKSICNQVFVTLSRTMTSPVVPSRPRITFSVSIQCSIHKPLWTNPLLLSRGSEFGFRPRWIHSNQFLDSTSPIVTLSEIKRFLRKTDITHESGHTCLRVDCFICRKEKRKRSVPWDSGTIYINKTTGHFVCISCKTTGSWKNLQDLLLMAKAGQSFSKSSINFMKQGILSAKMESMLQDLEQSSVEVADLSIDEWTTVADQMNFTCLKKKSFEMYGARWNANARSIYLPVLSIEGKRIGYRKLCFEPNDVGTVQYFETSVPKQCDELFGWKPILQSLQNWKNQDIVLVKSALDALAIAETSPHFPLSLPLGSHHLPQELLPKLEHFDRLRLWLGSDLRSWETAKTFGRKLGEKRCKLVRPLEGQTHAFETLRNGLSIPKILGSAQSMEHKAITTFSKLREEVFAELNHYDQVAGVQWKRYPQLNKLLLGHRRGELTVVTGPTGSGKTTLCSDYSLDLCMQGVNTLWGSFEIKTVRLAKIMLTQFAGKNLENHLDEYENWADEFEKLPLYFMTFHGQQGVKAVLDAMTHAVYVYDIAHVVVDNLQFMLGVSDDIGGNIDRFWKQDLIVSAFRKFATANNCHVTLVMHPRKEQSDVDLSNNSIFGGAKASQEADNILILQDRRLSTPRGRKYLQVTKNRFSGDLGIFPLEFHRESLSFAARKKLIVSRPQQQSENKELKTDEDCKSDDEEEL